MRRRGAQVIDRARVFDASDAVTDARRVQCLKRVPDDAIKRLKSVLTVVDGQFVHNTMNECTPRV